MLSKEHILVRKAHQAAIKELGLDLFSWEEREMLEVGGLYTAAIQTTYKTEAKYSWQSIQSLEPMVYVGIGGGQHHEFAEFVTPTHGKVLIHKDDLLLFEYSKVIPLVRHDESVFTFAHLSVVYPLFDSLKMNNGTIVDVVNAVYDVVNRQIEQRLVIRLTYRFNKSQEVLTKPGQKAHLSKFVEEITNNPGLGNEQLIVLLDTFDVKLSLGFSISPEIMK